MTSFETHDGLYRLVPMEGVTTNDGRFVATSTCPWLRVEPVGAFARHRWIRLRYASSFFDEPVRPLIRFTTGGGRSFVQPMNGTALGSADWIGRVPDDTIAVAISPCRRPGPFAFRIDALESVSRLTLLQRGLQQDHLWLLWALRSRLLNSRQEAWQALKYAAVATPMADYAVWHSRHTRLLDLQDFDRPRADWQRTPTFHLLLKSPEGASATDLQITLKAMRDQVYPRWQLYAEVGTIEPAARDAFRHAMQSDPRLHAVGVNGWPGSLETFHPDDRVMIIGAGDTMPNHALAAFAEDIVRAPQLTAIYADEDALSPEGTLCLPAFKPDWSPIYQAGRRYVGRPLCVRFGDIADSAPTIVPRLVSEEEFAIDEILDLLPRDRVGHLRRPLYSRKVPVSTRYPGKNENIATALPPRVGPPDPKEWPPVGIVIPTRDQSDLLAECIRGLRDKTDYPRFEVVIVDNGSTATDATALLRDIETDMRFKVLRRPGPFNFSALSNEGANATRAPVLVFLNNDIAMHRSDWLKPMVRWAIRPEIGLVGAKLLFPNGRIQHAGVVLGLGGIAGHIYRDLTADHRGYMDRLTVPHEVSAITAACVAVERTKFEAVGGFDADNLPIDLNDIDLCLRIAERGWTNLWTPEAELIHVQSGSRGIEKDPFTEYHKERDYFVRRWAHMIRDDPYFHPSLSLFARDAALA